MGTDILKPSRKGCWKKFENQIKSSAWACPQRIQKGIWAFPEQKRCLEWTEHHGTPQLCFVTPSFIMDKS